MEIKCPKCNNSFECRETWDLSICPHCSASLEVAHAENGFMLVGIDEDARPCRAVPEAAVEDPVTEDYSRWRTRAVFCMLFGAVLAVIMVMDIAHGILGYGAYFFKSLKNQLFITILGLTSACCIGGGAWLFRYLGKEREKYLNSPQRSQRPQRKTGKMFEHHRDHRDHREKMNKLRFQAFMGMTLIHFPDAL